MASNTDSNDKCLKLITKQCLDLEDLTKKLIELQNQKQDDLVLNQNECMISDDCLELQKFCAKLEFLLQFKLKEKKSLLSSDRNISLNNHGSIESNREYWSFFLEALKSSRSFQDGIKYVKNLTEIKTNLGRGRAFIRFCLHYHRLADAIQQLMMEDKQVNNWYQDKAVWYDQELKSRIFQLLYDLNDVNFDLISKNNFELDTTWPTCQLPNKQFKPLRNRTASISSFVSFNIDAASLMNQTDNLNSLLSSTPLEMDDNLSRLNRSHPTDDEDESVKEISNNNQPVDPSSETAITKLNAQIEFLTEQLNFKTKQNTDMNNCLIKQTNLSETLSDLLKKSQQKNSELETLSNKETNKLLTLQNDYDTLNQELKSVKFELSAKIIQEESLIKETLAQTQSIMSLKQMCSQQEIKINQLKTEYNAIKEERNNEVDMYQHDIKRLQVAIQLKEEENYLLNDQIQKLSKSLDEERKQTAQMTKEMNELRSHYKNLNEKNSKQINQLEMDNNEIKKRLVKLIKEKADLWQKADNLEYENLLKTNAMWIDDASISNCMSCKSGFSLILRKHHCRICLKIYCYYCCNNWIEYNHSQLRVCQRCFESKINMSRVSVTLKSNETVDGAKSTLDLNDDVEEDDDDPDINFEVRSEKLNLSEFNSAEHSDADDLSIYKSNKTSIEEPPENIKVNITDDLSKQLDVTLKLDEKPHAYEFKHEFKLISNISEEANSDLIVKRKKVKKKLKPNQTDAINQNKLDNSALDYDYDTFAIVSQEEIDKV